ncbi:MAG: ATP-binding protein [Cyanobacteria bacterium P01_H01_bin.21]
MTDLDQLMSAALSASNVSLAVQAITQAILVVAKQGKPFQDLVDWLPQAVVKTLDLQGCHIELYDRRQQTVTLAGGFGVGQLSPLHQSHAINKSGDIYQSLTRGKITQLSAHPVTPASTAPLTWLGCPMLSCAELLGTVWFTRPVQETFGESESAQLQQIADCVAIALHQSQLQQTINTQKTKIQQLQKAKEELLKLISHELFIPLGSIQLSAQTLEKIFKDSSWRQVPQRSTVLKVLGLLSQECRRQKQFVDTLVTLMFPEHQKAQEPVSMNLSDWLPSLLRSFETRFDQESLKLTANIPKSPLLIDCDIVQLERVITELVNNAIKYTPADKTVKVTVSATDTAVEIAIANTGVQIPPKHQPHIFDKFYRVTELDQRQYGGSGLGLALVKQLVANLEGTIDLKSTKQKTTFIVKLPR